MILQLRITAHLLFSHLRSVRTAVVAAGRMVLAAACLLAVPAVSTAQATGRGPALAVVPQVDWSRYAGRWFEVARLPNSFQRKCVADVTAQYTALPSGAIQVVNQCRRDDRRLDEATGEARQVSGEESKLQVRFAPKWISWLPAVWGDYWVIGLDEGYQTALVGTPDREFLWLLSRTPQRPTAEIDAWLQQAAALGFDIDRVLRTPQTAENPVPSPSAPPPPAPASPAADQAASPS